MTSYAHLSYLQTFLMTIIAALSNFAAIPVVLKLITQKNTHFQATIVTMSVFTSFLYHLCQIYDCKIFLDELQWHRLDNVFAITSFELIILHAFGSVADDDVVLRWSTLLSSLIIQEKDPWNVTYTVAPCLCYVVISIALRLYFQNSRKIIYDRINMQISLIPFTFGLFFFFLGLDDASDYLRIFHGLWHICASIFGYYCMSSVRVISLKVEIEKRRTQLEF